MIMSDLYYDRLLADNDLILNVKSHKQFTIFEYI